MSELLELAIEMMMAGVESRSKGGCIFAIIILILTALGIFLFLKYYQA
ncbi:MAG: hypothetical protein KDH96_07220 [Candidatus Riesia sp.]|nr:hypothetical protein [Candidatus Riesia sp.]